MNQHHDHDEDTTTRDDHEVPVKRLRLRKRTVRRLPSVRSNVQAGGYHTQRCYPKYPQFGDTANIDL